MANARKRKHARMAVAMRAKRLPYGIARHTLGVPLQRGVPVVRQYQYHCGYRYTVFTQRGWPVLAI